MLRPIGRMVTCVLLALVALVLSVPQGTGAAATRLTFWHHWEGTSGDTITRLVKEFNKTHPNVQVTEVCIPGGELLTKLEASIGAKSPPDMASGDVIWVPRLNRSGLLANLNTYIAESKMDVDDFYPSLLTYDRYGTDYVALPVSTNNLALLWNKDTFRAAGLDPNKPPKTWDELVSYATKIARPDKGQWGYALFTEVGDTGEGLTWQFMVFLWQNRGEFLTADCSGPAFNSEAGVGALRFWVDLIHKHKVAPLEPWGAFGRGNAAMAIDGSWMVNIWKETAPFDFGVATPPIPAGGRQATNLGGEHIFMFEGDPARERACWEFMSWLTDAKTQVDWCKSTGYLPVRKSTAKDPAYVSWLSTQEPRLIPFVELQQFAKPRPPIPQYPKVAYAFATEMEKALQGKVSPEKAMANAEAQVKAVLAQK